MNTMQFGERKPMLTFPSEKRAMVLLNERVVTIPASEEEGMEREEQTVYEYDGMFLDVEMPTEASVLEQVKRMKIAGLMAYDSSDSVNSFLLNGRKMWLDKATRVGLSLRFAAEQESGASDTTLWMGGSPYSLNITQAVAMLNATERYASQCYDRTQKHLASIDLLGSIADVVAYDFTTGYPEKPVF